MSRPVLYRIDAFDAGDSFTFTFSYSGNQVFSNQFVIRNNLTNAVVYRETISSMQLAHTVPKDTLVNGVCYNACVAVFDNNNIKSDFSEKIVFYCYSTPSLSFSNIDENQIIRNASYPIELSYLQSEGEVLNSYQIFLYNSLMQIVYQSGVKYDVSNLTGVIDQLEDNSAYFVRATGRTLHNMQADTGLVPNSVEYESPPLFALVGLENIKRTGEIKIASNIISIEGSSSPSPPVYMNNDFVDVRDMGAKVWFDKGFCASGD